jgi:hypothetical protein
MEVSDKLHGSIALYPEGGKVGGKGGIALDRILEENHISTLVLSSQRYQHANTK